MITLDPHANTTESALPLFSAEHDAYREAARAFVAGEITPHVEEWEAARDFPREVFRLVGGAGHFGSKFDERWGGSGPDPVAAAIWCEELARCGSGGVGADLGAHSELACVYVDRAGTDEQKQQWLVPSITGEVIGGLGITEPDAGSDVNGIRTRAVRDGDDWVLNGSKVFITNGAWADYVVVAAKTNTADDAGHRGMTLFIVDTTTPGFEARRMKMSGWRTSHTGELSLTDVRVPDHQRLGDEGAGFYAIMQNFAWERLFMSLGAVIAAEEGLQAAIAYGRQREAFGRPVGSFQVWKHRFADMATQVELGRALTHHALRLHTAFQAGEEVDQTELLRATSMAKLHTQRMAHHVADECVQIHGGNGYLMEFPAQRFWRDTRLGPIGGGTDDIMREIIAGTYGL